MQKEFSKELFDRNDAKNIQLRLCEIADVFAICYDKNGSLISEMTGNEEDLAILQNSIDKDKVETIIRRLGESDLEDQIIEDTQYYNLKIAATALKNKQECIAIWIVVGNITDAEPSGYLNEPITGLSRQTTTKKFIQSVDFIRDICDQYIEMQVTLANAEAENRKSRYSAKEMEVSLHRIEVTTELVQLLDSDQTIEAIMADFLKITGTFLNISSAQIFRVKSQVNDLMDVVVEWRNQGIIAYFDQTINQKRFSFLYGDKPTAISSDARLGPQEREEIALLHIKAFMTFPIVINKTINMYACFCEAKEDRIWQIDEIRFLNDAVRVLQNIIEKRLQKNSLASSYAALEAVLDNVGCAIYVRDTESEQMLFANRILKSTFQEEIKNGTLNQLFSNKNKETGNYEVHSEENNRWYELHKTQIKWVDGRNVSLYAVYDITDKKVYQGKIEQQAYTDFLTGLYNRMCCEKDLAWQIDCAKKNHQKGALLYLDLDDFKHINDGLGHQYGDVLLKAISHSLQRINGISNTCYRMGGDEFVIVIPPKSYPLFEQIVEEIKKVFAKPWFLKDADYYCTMSMGVVDFPDEGESVEDLIKKADIAMYEAKKSGKNRVAQYSDRIDSPSSKRLDMEKNMRDATVNGYREFEIYYQPIIDIQKPGNPCTGAEALIRWNSVELGFISPAEFIPLAEYLGLINPIGNHVLQEACITCKEWNDNGFPNYKVNVNLSVVQLLQTDIVEIVSRTLKETGILAKNLTLEVTESLAINDMDRMKEIMSDIKKLGVRIALDDFGTGYSSLNHIREIPLDVIKVDQTFVKDLVEEDYPKAFIKMVAGLANEIGVSICVEGIENKEQYKVLEGMKVQLVQGYYFGKPMKKEEFEEKYVTGLKK